MSAMTISVARADPMGFVGCPAVQLSGRPVRPVPGPAGLSGLLALLAGWPGLAGLRDALASRSFPLLPVRVSAANLC